MSAPVCRECDACKSTPVCDEDTGDELWAFDCLDAKRCIEVGWDESDALPKTSPRWCPLRKGAKKDD